MRLRVIVRKCVLANCGYIHHGFTLRVVFSVEFLEWTLVLSDGMHSGPCDVTQRGGVRVCVRAAAVIILTEVCSFQVPASLIFEAAARPCGGGRTSRDRPIDVIVPPLRPWTLKWTYHFVLCKCKGVNYAVIYVSYNNEVKLCEGGIRGLISCGLFSFNCVSRILF